MDEESLSELGMSKNESKIYQTLIKFGKMGSNDLSIKSGVPYGRVYDFLGSLIEKGLVKIIPEKTKKFVATDPEQLSYLVDKKQNSLDKLREDIKTLKKFYESKEKEAVQVVYGEKGFWEIVNEQKKPENYSYNIRWDFRIKAGNIQEQKDWIKKGIDVKNLSRFDKETEKNVLTWVKSFPKSNIRVLDNEGVAISVVDDEEVLIGLIKSNTTILIKDKAFSKIMKKMFLETYKNSEEVKQNTEKRSKKKTPRKERKN